MKWIGDFFSELTDIDKGFLQTTVALIRRPNEVVASYLADDATHVKPLKYALITSSIYSVLVILFNLFSRDEAVNASWRWPSRIASFDEKLSGFTESFFPFILMISIVPISVLLLKVLFYEKTLRQHSVLMLYAFGLYWLIGIPTLAIPSTQYSYLLEPLTVFTIVCLCFRNVIGGNFFMSLGKWIVVCLILIAYFYYVVTPVVAFSYARITGVKTPVEYRRPDVMTARITKMTGVSFDIPWNAVRDDSENRSLFLVEQDSITYIRCMDEDLVKLWELGVHHFRAMKMARLVALPNLSRGILVIGQGKEVPNSRAPHRMLVLSEDGGLLYDKTFDLKTLVNDGITIKGDVLLLTGGKEVNEEINPVILTMKLNSNGVLSNENDYSISRPGKRFNHVFYMSSSSNDFNLMVGAYENPQGGFKEILVSEITELSMMRISVDTAIHVIWETPVFKKITKYSPQLDYVKTTYDSVNQRAILGYSLSDDDALSAELVCISSQGKMLWERRILIGEFNFIWDIVAVNNWIYFCGNSSWFTPQHPFVNNYYLAIAGRISSDGREYSEISYGSFQLYAGHYFPKMIVHDDTLKMFLGVYEEGLLGVERQSGIISIEKSNFLSGIDKRADKK